MAPLVANLHTIGAEAARASALATAQVERADRLFADVSAKVEETTSVVQQAIMAPAREGLAVMAGLRAALTSLRDARQARRDAAQRGPTKTTRSSSASLHDETSVVDVRRGAHGRTHRPHPTGWSMSERLLVADARGRHR